MTIKHMAARVLLDHEKYGTGPYKTLCGVYLRGTEKNRVAITFTRLSCQRCQRAWRAEQRRMNPKLAERRLHKLERVAQTVVRLSKKSEGASALTMATRLSFLARAAKEALR